MGWNHQVDSRYGSAVWYLLYLKLGFLGYQIVVPRRCQNPDVLPKYPNIHSLYFLGLHPSNSQAWFWKELVFWRCLKLGKFSNGCFTFKHWTRQWNLHHFLGCSPNAVISLASAPLPQLLCQGLCWRRWRGCQSRTQCCWLYFITSGLKFHRFPKEVNLSRWQGWWPFHFYDSMCACFK